MYNISIRVRNRHAQLMSKSVIVCGNSDYAVTFDFDAEWSAYPTKTAHFVYHDEKGIVHWIDVEFQGDTCNLPVLCRIDSVGICVFAGEIRTSSPVLLKCRECITDALSTAYTPPRDIYNEIMELLARIVNERSDNDA